MTWDKQDSDPLADLQRMMTAFHAAAAYRPRVMVTSGPTYTRLQWELAKTRIFHDWAMHLFPRWTRAARFIRRRRLDLHFWLDQRRHPHLYA